MSRRWSLPVIFWVLLILALTWYPQVELPDLGFDAQDKAAHFIVFFILGFLLMRAYSKYEIKRLPQAVYRTILFGICFAVIDEVGQVWIPGRMFDTIDGLFNVLGVVTAVILFPKVLLPLLKKYQMLW